VEARQIAAPAYKMLARQSTRAVTEFNGYLNFLNFLINLNFLNFLNFMDFLTFELFELFELFNFTSELRAKDFGRIVSPKCTV
jgi:hypothetical protein